MTHPTYTLHYWPDSASIIVRLALRLTDATFAEVLIDREAGALDSPAYRALHPLGKIPAMETPEGPMFETAAILLYLADRHGLAPKDRAGFLSWLFFASTNLHAPLMLAFYPERLAGEACADAVRAGAGQQLRDHFAVFDAMVARARPDWFSETSVLAFYIGTMLRWLSSLPADHPAHMRSAGFPAIHAILQRAETTPAALAVAEAESLGATIFTNPEY